MSSPEVERFKYVVGHFVTGVAVITAQGDDAPLGFTCQSFGSLSLEPMLVSFAAQVQSRSWPLINRVGRIGISILSTGQESLARGFAMSGPNKFVDVEWSPSPHGAPLLAGALAHLDGEVVSVTTHGDHDVAIVAVDFAQSHPGSPLLFFRGGFDVIH